VAFATLVPGTGGGPWGVVGTEMSSASIPRSAAPGRWYHICPVHLTPHPRPSFGGG
jgi:hypothetical protein